MVTRAAAAAAATLALAACPGQKPRGGDDARRASPRGDAGAADASGAAGSAAPASPPTGDVQVRVEWRDVPAAARASPGRTPCNTARRPAVAPTTTWGIPDALVLVEGARPPAPGAEPRIVLADCRLTPPLAVGGAILVETAMDRPARLSLGHRGDVARLDALTPPASPRPIQLPIAGHAVALSLDAGAVYELITDAPDPESAWLVAAPASVTDASGQVILRELAPGSHSVTAWLPPRAGQPGRLARGKVTVVARELAELVLVLPP